MSGEAALTPAQRALLEQRVRGRAIASTPHRFAVAPRTPQQPAPLSAEQEQILYHSYFLAGNPIYNEAVTIVKKGSLDLDALRRALTRFAARHDIWHTTFRRIDRQWRQVVGPPLEFELPLHDLAGLPEESRAAEGARLMTELSSPPYDLRSGPLVRASVVRTAEDEHRLLLALHHLVFDGVSLYRIVLPELITLYDAEVAEVPAELPPAVQYADYAVWERSGVLDDEAARFLPYWREHLAGAPTLNLPLGRPRPSEPTYRGTTVSFSVPPAVTARLRELGLRSGGTLFHVLVGAFALLLHRCSGDEDVVFATVADLRRRREFEQMVGYCLSPMPLRLRVSPDAPFGTLVGQVREELLTGLSHLLPFDTLVTRLDPPRVPGANPIVQAMIVLEPPAPAVDPHWSMHQLDAASGEELGHAKLDFHMELDERPDGRLSGRFTYNSDVFDADFGARVIADWLDLLSGLTATV